MDSKNGIIKVDIRLSTIVVIVLLLGSLFGLFCGSAYSVFIWVTE